MKKYIYFIFCIAATVCMIGCNKEEPEEPEKTFEELACGKVWKITHRSVIDSKGNEFTYIKEGGKYDVGQPSYTVAFYFTKNRLAQFFYFNDGLYPYFHSCRSTKYSLDTSSNWITTEKVLVDENSIRNSSYLRKFKLTSVTENEMIIDIWFGCMPLNFPDYDWRWPNPDKNPYTYDEGSYTRYKLEPIDDIEWLAIYEPRDEEDIICYEELFGVPYQQ